MYCMPGLKVGRMTRTIWVTWVAFWRVKWVSSANQIIWMWPGYHVFFRQQCWHLVSEWTLGLINALKYNWCETSLLSQAVLKHVMSEDFTFVQGTSSVFCPRMKKSMVLLHIKKFSGHVTLVLKRKLQHVGHKWVTSGSHSDCSVGQWVK